MYILEKHVGMANIKEDYFELQDNIKLKQKLVHTTAHRSVSIVTDPVLQQQVQ